MYNAEKVIERTLRSILNTNLPRDFYEVIVVDDGSTDSSLDVINGLMHLFPNLKTIVQENGGSSKARNAGLRETLADYIWFVDADDMVEKDISCIPQLIAAHPSVDIFSFTYNWVSENGQHVGYGQLQERVKHEIEISGREAILQGYQPGSVCGLVIRRTFLTDNNLKFKEGITQQDVELTYRMFARAKVVFFSSKVVYNYMFCPTSITRSNNVKKRMKYELDKVEIIKSFRQQAEFFKDTDPELSIAMKSYADSALFGYVYNLFKQKSKWRKMGISTAALDMLKENRFYPLKIEGLGWKKLLVSKVLNIERIIR
jgi:glycosyltransferase, group 2 family protein